MDDYIKRNQALCCFSGWVDSHGDFHEPDEMIEYQRIEQLTAADVVPVVHGRWIIRTRHEHYPSGRVYEEIVCPFCGKVDHNGDGNFCGYCGADMRKDGDDE